MITAILIDDDKHLRKGMKSLLEQYAPEIRIIGEAESVKTGIEALEKFRPQVVFLEKMLNEQFGPGTVRVICPITDPFVKHHGALGSFATVYVDADKVQSVIDAAGAIDGVTVAIAAAEAGERFELPIDRIGDVVVICDRHKVLGTTAARHDFSGLTEPLRSHGGLTEQRVPLISNRPTEVTPDRILRNFDAFDMALNLVR